MNTITVSFVPGTNIGTAIRTAKKIANLLDDTITLKFNAAEIDIKNHTVPSIEVGLYVDKWGKSLEQLDLREEE